MPFPFYENRALRSGLCFVCSLNAILVAKPDVVLRPKPSQKRRRAIGIARDGMKNDDVHEGRRAVLLRLGFNW